VHEIHRAEIDADVREVVRVAEDEADDADHLERGLRFAFFTRGDDDAEVKQLVLTSLRDLEDTQPADPAVTVVPAASATPAAVHPTAKPTVRATPRLERKHTDD